MVDPVIMTDTDSPNKYNKRIYSVDGKESIVVDVYSVIAAWAVDNPGSQHALKKILMPGKRGAKDEIKDMNEAILSMQRAIVVAQAGSENKPQTSSDPVISQSFAHVADGRLRTYLTNEYASKGTFTKSMLRLTELASNRDKEDENISIELWNKRSIHLFCAKEAYDKGYYAEVHKHLRNYWSI